MKKEKSSNELVFVVQKHATVRAHYDFRLQIGTVMPSWAIPKGPTLDPAAKRLAMETTDHDMEYRNYEGVIAEGQYGAGGVMVWDQGIYIPEIEVSKGVLEKVEDPKEGLKVMKEGMEKGQLKFTLLGSKLKGSFALVKTKGFGPKDSWLMIKHKDEYVKEGYDANDYDVSVISKRTMQEIVEGK